MGPQFELVIRNGTVATAADTFSSDISQSEIVALARDLPDGTEEIDATGLLVLPGGNTCILPYALRRKGQSLRDAVADYHRMSVSKCFGRFIPRSLTGGI